MLSLLAMAAGSVALGDVLGIGAEAGDMPQEDYDVAAERSDIVIDDIIVLSQTEEDSDPAYELASIVIDDIIILPMQETDIVIDDIIVLPMEENDTDESYVDIVIDDIVVLPISDGGEMADQSSADFEVYEGHLDMTPVLAKAGGEADEGQPVAWITDDGQPQRGHW